jgi:hypothetical protein
VTVPQVTPEALVAALIDAGWEEIGHGKAHKRLAIPGESTHRQHVMVPLDTEAPEFDEMWNAVLSQLITLADDGESARHAVRAIDPALLS